MKSLELFRNRPGLLIGTAFVAFAIGAALNAYQHMPRYHGPHGYTQDVADRIGRDNVALIAHADKIEVMRVEGGMKALIPDAGSEVKVDDCILRASRTFRSGLEVDDAKRLILDRATYEGPFASCAIDPGLIIRFWHGKEHVDALICFACEQTGIVDDQHTDPYAHQGSVTPNWEAWVAFARRAYPNDLEFRALPMHSPHSSMYPG